MEILKLTLTAEENLVLTDGSAESMGHQTLEYIPGNMLLGAFAYRWKKLHKGINPDDNQEFRDLFLNAKVEWGHAYPQVDKIMSLPIPLSFQKIKNYDGLPNVASKDTDLDKCRVYNFLQFQDEDTLKVVYNKDFPKDQNSSEEEQVKASKLPLGFMHPTNCCRPNLEQTWTMHVAIAKGNQGKSSARVAAESQLFGYSSLASGLEFESQIYCHDQELAKQLLKLVNDNKVIYVGHARSAGYGRVTCSLAKMDKAELVDQTDNLKTKQEATLFLASDYLPRHSWDNPLDSFKNELAEVMGLESDSLKLDKYHSAYTSIAGFNGLWQLPRRTRTGLLRGSVFKISWSGEAKFSQTSIGSWRQEGYGRIIFNPAFLEEKRIKPSLANSNDTEAQSKPTAQSTTKEPSALVKIIRRRSLERLVNEVAINTAFSEAIQEFLDSAVHPSPNQRGNLRQLITNDHNYKNWLAQFEAILDKTPGEQWKKADAKDPFDKNKRHEHLHEIMRKLLDLKQCKELFQGKYDILPGGKMSDKERSSFEEKTHRIFLLEMLNIWDKIARRKN